MELNRSRQNLCYEWWKNIDKFIFSLIILLFITGLFFSLVSTSLLISDKLELSKKYFKNIKAFIYGKDKKIFSKKLKDKIKYKNFNNLKEALKEIFMIVKKERPLNSTILFSPCAASFDNFKNFEDRGLYFNKLVKMYKNEL